MPRIPTFVVNLPEDKDRLDRLKAKLDPSIFEFRERAGVLGRTLPDTVCLRLTSDPASPSNKGALGVMLSHVSLWEQVAGLGSSFALLLEDDVDVTGIERLGYTSPPPDFDIVFCGDQSAYDRDAGASVPLSCIPVANTVPLLEQRAVSIGAYGYLLSPLGAQRLLTLFERHHFFGHVDVRMLAYCCDSAELDRTESPGRLTEELRAIRRFIGQTPKLTGYATIQPLANHVGMTSRRDREDMLGKTSVLPNRRRSA